MNENVRLRQLLDQLEEAQAKLLRLRDHYDGLATSLDLSTRAEAGAVDAWFNIYDLQSSATQFLLGEDVTMPLPHFVEGKIAELDQA